MYYYEQAIFEKNNSNEKTIPEKLLGLSREKLYYERHVLFDDCERIQCKILKDIVDHAQGSAYAEDHQFHNVIDLKTWQKYVPITVYEDYKPYINAEIAGVKHQLYNTETEMYIATTGSTGCMKLFMESAAGNAAKLLVMAIRGMYMATVLPVTRDMDAKNLTISNYMQLGNTPDGKKILRASGQTARNLRKKTGTMNILSTSFWEMPDIAPEDREYMMGVFALAERRLSKVFCNNLYAFGKVLDQIEWHAQQMIEDIRSGHMSVEMSDANRQELQKLFSPNLERADELQQLISTQGKLVHSPESLLRLWPNFQMVSCWLSGSVGRDAREVMNRLPSKIKCFDMGYGASESKINIPAKLADASGIAAIFSLFFEFLPLEKGKRPLFAWEVKDGEHYELIISTYSGLYRYNMLDIVRIDGFTGKTPNIVFCGKSTEYLWFNDHKIYAYEFSDIVYEIEKRYGYCFDVFQIFQDEEQLYFVMGSRRNVEYRKVKKLLDQAIQREWNTIIPQVGIIIVGAEYKQHEFNKRVRIDRGICGIKLPVILRQMPDRDDIVEIIQ